MQHQRQTAYKLWIANILNSPYTKTTEEFAPNYITFNDTKISRVNIVANVLETFVSPDNAHASIILDDGSGTIRARSFKDDVKLLTPITMGDVVMVIGKIREYNNELYMVPEIVKRLDNTTWLKVRQLELLKLVGKAPQQQQVLSSQPEHPPSTINATSETAQRVLSLVNQSEEGISADSIALTLSWTREIVDQALQELIKKNEIYQNKPGHYKAL